MGNAAVLRTLAIRRAKPSDLDALVDLELRAFSGDRLSRRQFRRHLRSDSVAVLVARDADRLLGDAVVFFRRDSAVARLYSLVSAPQARGRGLGRALLAAAEREARRRHCRSMRLEVRADNPDAIDLYERNGYARIGRKPGYYEDGADAWRYQKELGA